MRILQFALILLGCLFVMGTQAHGGQTLRDKIPFFKYADLKMVSMNVEGDDQIVVQKACTDATCDAGCNSTNLKQNTCVPANGGGSLMMSCIKGAFGGKKVEQDIFSDQNCQQLQNKAKAPQDKCLRTTDPNLFVDFTCVDPSAEVLPMVADLKMESMNVGGDDQIVVQKACTDATCDAGCNSTNLKQNTCVPANGGGSLMMSCIKGAFGVKKVEQDIFSDQNCQQLQNSAKAPQDKCLRTTDPYLFVDFTCVDPSN